MRVRVRPEAAAELLDALSWYAQRSPELGAEFSLAIDAAVSRAARMPLAFPSIEADFRHVLVRKFPYSVIYHASAAELVVISFFHHRRKPGAWRGNLERQA